MEYDPDSLMKYDGDRLSNSIAYVNINSWKADACEPIYFELYRTELFDSERAAAVMSPVEARNLARILLDVADVFDAHKAAA